MGVWSPNPRQIDVPCFLTCLLLEADPKLAILFLQSLALAHADTVDDKVVLSAWTETDFRTGEKPWWS
jgi:hypothetical protein